MDSGLTIRPIANVAQTAQVRPQPASVAVAAPTTLPASKTVAAAPESAGAGVHDPARHAAAEPHTTRDIIFDPQTREVIYRVIDTNTGLVNYQVPDAAILRIKAYARAMTSEQGPESESLTDHAV
jgi:hypothetical protein